MRSQALITPRVGFKCPLVWCCLNTGQHWAHSLWDSSDTGVLGRLGRTAMSTLGICKNDQDHTYGLWSPDQDSPANGGAAMGWAYQADYILDVCFYGHTYFCLNMELLLYNNN